MKINLATDFWIQYKNYELGNGCKEPYHKW